MTPGWIWLVLLLAIILFMVAFILYCLDIFACQKIMAIAEACGELAPKKAMPCPKLCGVENKLLELEPKIEELNLLMNYL